MEMKQVEFAIMLTLEDRYRHHHVRLKRTVLSFRVQYETKVEGKWLPVVRYNTSHGFAHRDLMDRRGKEQKMPLFTHDYNEALTFVEHDVKTNWKAYKERFLRG